MEVCFDQPPRDLWEAFRSCEGLRSCLEEDGRFSGRLVRSPVKFRIFPYQLGILLVGSIIGDNAIKHRYVVITKANGRGQL